MHLPDFGECQHPLIQALQGYSDRELLQQWQAEPTQGRAFVALFCRYALLVYSLVRHAAPTPAQADYLFARTWHYLYRQLRDFSPPPDMTHLQSWLVDRTGDGLQQVELPAPEQIRYRLSLAPPPLWCYLQEALDQLAAPLRLLMLLKAVGNWSDEQIGQELDLPPAQVAAFVSIGENALRAHLPADICAIYLQEEVLP